MISNANQVKTYDKIEDLEENFLNNLKAKRGKPN